MPITVKENQEKVPTFIFDFSEGINCRFQGRIKDTNDFLYLVGIFDTSNMVRKVKSTTDGKFDGYDDDYSLVNKIAIGRVRKTVGSAYGKTYTPTDWDKLIVEKLTGEDFADKFIALRMRLGELYRLDYEEDKAEGKEGWEDRYLNNASLDNHPQATEINTICDGIKSYSAGSSKKFVSEKQKLEERLQFLIDNEESLVQLTANFAVSLHYNEIISGIRDNEKLPLTDSLITAIFSAIASAL